MQKNCEKAKNFCDAAKSNGSSFHNLETAGQERYVILLFTVKIIVKEESICHVAERTFTNGKMAGGRVAIFVAEHLPARRNISRPYSDSRIRGL